MSPEDTNTVIKESSSDDDENRTDELLVSVVIPTYEDSEYVDSAVDSVLNQSYDNIEIILVDSSGVSRLSERAENNKNIIYVFQEPRGLSAARNRGIDRSNGDVVAFLDADDRWRSDKLTKQIQRLEAGTHIVYSDRYVIEEGKKQRMSSLPVKDDKNHHLDFLYEGGVPIPTVIVREECLDGIRFDESLDAVEDRHLVARLFREFEPAYVPEPLAYYNRRDDSMSSDAEMMYESELEVLDDLTERYSELQSHEDKLKAIAKYKYGKRLLREGRAKDARKQLGGAILGGFHDVRCLALLPITVLPFGHRTSLWYCERIQELLR
jgi:glycosyltransferase involved in cell wall biosynthesis